MLGLLGSALTSSTITTAMLELARDEDTVERHWRSLT